jgi:hypothetical protein
VPSGIRDRSAQDQTGPALFEAHDGEARSIILLELPGKSRQLKIDRDHLWTTVT